MSFNKRILCKENILNNIDNLSGYLGNPDAVFMTDDFSKEVFHMFTEGKTEEEIINYINKNK
jgi:hypothetical protein